MSVLYVIRNAMRLICSSPVLYRSVIDTQLNSHIHIVHKGKSALRADNLMNLPSSMCAHLLVQPLVPTSITITLMEEGGGVIAYLWMNVQVCLYECKTI